jgi:hypothetical protein
MAMTYDANLIGVKLSVVDELLLLNPHQTPLISMLGFGEAVTQTTHQWYEDEMYATETLTTATALIGGVTVSVADGSIFRAGDVVKIGSELLKVTAIATNDLTVTRGYAGTTAAAVNNAAPVQFMFVEGTEGAAARAARYKSRTAKSNYTQIFDDTVSVSGSAQAVTQYGVSNLYEYEKQKKQLELVLQLEKALINGISYESGQVRQMKGIRSFINTNVTPVGGPLTEVKINDLAQDIYEAGGFKTGGNYKIIVPATQKRVVSGFGATALQLERTDLGRGSVADYFVSDFGQFEIVLNNNLAASELLLVDTNRMAIRPLVGRDFFHKYMGEVGDSTTGTLVGEYTLELMQEKAHGRLATLA